jgi:hypothetical protein
MGELIYKSTFFLNSALVGGEWSASRPGRFTPGESAPGTHSIGGWVNPKSRSGRCGENSWPHRDSNSDPSVVQPVANRYTDCAIPALQIFRVGFLFFWWGIIKYTEVCFCPFLIKLLNIPESENASNKSGLFHLQILCRIKQSVYTSNMLQL